MAEEEEAATRARSFTYLEDFVAILFDVERFNDLPDGHFVDGEEPLEVLLVVADDRVVLAQLRLLVIQSLDAFVVKSAQYIFLNLRHSVMGPFITVRVDYLDEFVKRAIIERVNICRLVDDDLASLVLAVPQHRADALENENDVLDVDRGVEEAG